MSACGDIDDMDGKPQVLMRRHLGRLRQQVTLGQHRRRAVPQAAGLVPDRAAGALPASASPRRSARRRRLGLLCLIVLAPILLARVVAPAFAQDDAREVQRRQYDADVPKTIIELQPFRRTETTDIAGAGDASGQAALVNLNPAVGSWYLLQLRMPGEATARSYHLQTSKSGERLSLDSGFPDGILVSEGDRTQKCALWTGGLAAPLAQAAAVAAPYVPLCGGRVYLRNPTRGHKTLLESVTDFLRDNVWGGEEVLKFVRDSVLSDRQLQTGTLASSGGPAGSTASPAATTPTPAAIDAASATAVMPRGELGLELDVPAAELLAVGRWYPLRDEPGMFASVVEPRVIDKGILQADRDVVNALGDVEANAVVYLIAFDLSKFDLGFALGTDHPRVGWSDRTLPRERDDRLPGPDGIDTLKPLVATGMVAPPAIPRVAATFTGGFKRQHSAFKWGELATRNHGSHYGFIEEGVVASKLQPGLATLYVTADGGLDMKTWTEADNDKLPSVRSARQNGVPLIDFDETTRASVPGALVARWGPGNWSGTAEGQLRAQRGGACLQETAAGRFLIYAYFSGATPSAMARVFQAYRCRYAMQMDMNALEHTYLAVYRSVGGQRVVEHLVKGMSVLDEVKGDLVVPRFLGYADNRDFFYVLRRAP